MSQLKNAPYNSDAKYLHEAMGVSKDQVNKKFSQIMDFAINSDAAKKSDIAQKIRETFSFNELVFIAAREVFKHLDEMAALQESIAKSLMAGDIPGAIKALEKITPEGISAEKLGKLLDEIAKSKDDE